jgi:restriction system protein
MAEAERVLKSVRDLPWDGYRSLLADIFRRHGHDVFEPEGPDRDVIDLEVRHQRHGRMVVNCQLRGVCGISTEPLREMAIVALRNGADGAMMVTDGDFTDEAHRFAKSHSLVLVDGKALFELIFELAVGDERDRKLSARLARLLGTSTKN